MQYKSSFLLFAGFSFYLHANYYKMSKKPAPTNVSFKELIFTEEEKNAIENKDKARIE